MRFPLRRNANVLDTLLTETLQTLVVLSIIGWPFSGMQQCETKDMSVQQQQEQQQQHQQYSKEQQLVMQHLTLQQQHHYPQQQQEQQHQNLHKIPIDTLQQEQQSMTSGTPSSGSAYEYAELASVTATVAQPVISSSLAASLSMSSSSGSAWPSGSSRSSSSLGTHDMHHSAPTIITMDYQHKSVPTSSASGANVAYTQHITTATTRTTTTSKLSANEVTAHAQTHAAVSSAILSNGNANGVGVAFIAIRPPDMSLHSSELTSTSAWSSRRPLHRVSKDTQHSSVYAQLPSINSDSTANATSLRKTSKAAKERE